jgi:hypothetical protein
MRASRLRAVSRVCESVRWRVAVGHLWVAVPAATAVFLFRRRSGGLFRMTRRFPVNQTATPTGVRIPHSPHHAKRPRDLRQQVTGAFFVCPVLSGPVRPFTSVRGKYAATAGTGLRLLGQLEQVLQGTAEPVQFGDHQLVPRPGLAESSARSSSGRPGKAARRLVEERSSQPASTTVSYWFRVGAGGDPSVADRSNYSTTWAIRPGRLPSSSLRAERGSLPVGQESCFGYRGCRCLIRSA